MGIHLIALSSILVDAVTFLFGEGKKILQERLARTQSFKSDPTTEAKTTIKTSLEPPQLNEVITSKEAALNQEVPQIKWANSEDKVKHLMTLLKIQTRNYYLAKEQYSKWESNLVPAIIVNRLFDAEEAIAETTASLENELSKIYGKKIVVPEV
jgi:hypothetical protein